MNPLKTKNKKNNKSLLFLPYEQTIDFHVHVL